MTEMAIRVENLGKRYFIGATQEQYATLRDSVMKAISSPIRRASSLLQGHATGAADLHQAIWALKEISFEIKSGEVVGIIGQNGAGKSTLLKILSRITEPTEGEVRLRGRVSSLLEVGTGFHQELTGRENVYLNGAILGMGRQEIGRKFDEIVAFSEVEKFVDTPVKHYSSGMRLRLAFAVAAHLEPEILIVDEVLAVGDIRFQRKCINKMQDVGQHGRTVLFVSHNMSAVTRLCERGILLNGGRVIADGSIQSVVREYLEAGAGTTASREWSGSDQPPGGKTARLHAIRVRDQNDQVSDAIDIREPVWIEMEYEVMQPGQVLLPHFHLFNEEGIHVFASLDQDPEWRHKERPVGHYVSRTCIPGNFLAEGTLFVSPAMLTINPNQAEFFERDSIAFQVVDNIDGDSARGDWGGNLGGVIRPLLTWQTTYSQSSQPVSHS